MNRSLCIGLLLAAILLAYGNSLPNGFTRDDSLYITGNPQVTSVSLRACSPQIRSPMSSGLLPLPPLR